MRPFHSLLDYPWRKSSEALSSNLIKWLYLPDYAMIPNANFILCDLLHHTTLNQHICREKCVYHSHFLIYFQSDDCLLLLVASLQWQVFEDENQACVRLLAGENVEISRNLDPQTLNQYTPVNNFLHCRYVLVFH